MRKNIQFLGVLLLLLLVAFGIHVAVRASINQPIFEYQIISAYAVNFALASIILFLVERNMRDGSAKGGFIFFAGSLLKFIVFFVVFYPEYNADDNLQTREFTTFFIPYAICLISEVYYLGKELNNQST
ncbi:MAG: DUF6168 family protein [Marinirhabdus sp.]|nr:DUF6168 family protein [Marinirhabdus sp.]